MKDWSKPKEEEIDWSQPKVESAYNQPPPRPFLEKVNPFVLGLGQNLGEYGASLGNLLLQSISKGAEPETVDINEILGNKRERPQQYVPEIPSPNLQQYVEEGFGPQAQFFVGKYGPDVATLGTGLAKGLGKLSSKSVGNSIVKDVQGLKEAFKTEYNAIFDAAEKSGVKNIKSRVNKSDLESVLSEVDKKHYQGIEKFLENPTARNAHYAQSDLGKFIRKMQGKKELVSSEHEALKMARKAQDILKNEVYDTLLKQGGLELPFKYQDVTNRYKQQMVPYLENVSVRKAMLEPGEKGYMKPSRLPEKLRLQQSDPLMEHLRGFVEGTKTPINPYLKGKHPLLEYNKFLTSPLMKYGLGVGGLGYGSYELWKALMRGD